MRTTFFLLMTILVMQSVAPNIRGKEEDELIALEKAWNQAHVEGDATALEKLWDEELVVTVPEMPVMTKASSLAIWKSGKFRFDKYETSAIKARIVGGAGIVTGRVHRARNFQGTPKQDDWQFTKVYAKRNGEWKVVAWHASPAPQSK
jgi:ketosteroid isomerase-like protein